MPCFFAPYQPKIFVWLMLHCDCACAYNILKSKQTFKMLRKKKKNLSLSRAIAAHIQHAHPKSCMQCNEWQRRREAAQIIYTSNVEQKRHWLNWCCCSNAEILHSYTHTFNTIQYDKKMKWQRRGSVKEMEHSEYIPVSIYRYQNYTMSKSVFEYWAKCMDRNACKSTDSPIENKRNKSGIVIVCIVVSLAIICFACLFLRLFFFLVQFRFCIAWLCLGYLYVRQCALWSESRFKKKKQKLCSLFALFSVYHLKWFSALFGPWL